MWIQYQMKQYVDLEFIRVCKVEFWIWSNLQTSSDVKSNVNEFKSEIVVMLR